MGRNKAVERRIIRSGKCHETCIRRRVVECNEEQQQQQLRRRGRSRIYEPLGNGALDPPEISQSKLLIHEAFAVSMGARVCKVSVVVRCAVGAAATPLRIG
jgi:hypothetical protein